MAANDLSELHEKVNDIRNTVTRTQTLLETSMKTVEALDHRVNGNSTPGLVAEVRDLKKFRDDIERRERKILGFAIDKMVAPVVSILMAMAVAYAVARFSPPTQAQMQPTTVTVGDVTNESAAAAQPTQGE